MLEFSYHHQVNYQRTHWKPIHNSPISLKIQVIDLFSIRLKLVGLFGVIFLDLGNKKWSIGTILQFRCAGNAQLASQYNYSRCNEDAQWSNPIPSCMNSCIIPRLINATVLGYLPGK